MIHKIYFDGSTALNTVCIVDQDRNKSFLTKFGKEATNNELEYLGLLKAVHYASEYYGSPRNIVFCGDSELIVKQMKGEDKVHKVHLKELKNKVENEFIRKNTPMINSNFVWVPRGSNLAGIILETLLNEKRG